MNNDKGILRVYVEDGEFVVERINMFNHSTKRKFITEDGLRGGIEAYQPIADELNLEIQEDVTMENGEALLWRVADTLFD